MEEIQYDKNGFPLFPDAIKGYGWKWAIDWDHHPANPVSGYSDWQLEMGKRGWVLNFHEYDGSTIPQTCVTLSPMEDL